MARETTKWPSTRWPITKIMSSDGCNGNRVPLEMGPWYDFREFGCHLGNVGWYVFGGGFEAALRAGKINAGQYFQGATVAQWRTAAFSCLPTFPQEGGILDFGSWGLVQGSTQGEAAHTFMNHCTDPAVQTRDHARRLGTAPVVPRRLTTLTDQEFLTRLQRQHTHHPALRRSYVKNSECRSSRRGPSSSATRRECGRHGSLFTMTTGCPRPSRAPLAGIHGVVRYGWPVSMAAWGCEWKPTRAEPGGRRDGVRPRESSTSWAVVRFSRPIRRSVAACWRCRRSCSYPPRR